MSMPQSNFGGEMINVEHVLKSYNDSSCYVFVMGPQFYEVSIGFGLEYNVEQVIDAGTYRLVKDGDVGVPVPNCVAEDTALEIYDREWSNIMGGWAGDQYWLPLFAPIVVQITKMLNQYGDSSVARAMAGTTQPVVSGLTSFFVLSFLPDTLFYPFANVELHQDVPDAMLLKMNEGYYLTAWVGAVWVLASGCGIYAALQFKSNTCAWVFRVSLFLGVLVLGVAWLLQIFYYEFWAILQVNVRLLFRLSFSYELVGWSSCMRWCLAVGGLLNLLIFIGTTSTLLPPISDAQESSSVAPET